MKHCICTLTRGYNNLVNYETLIKHNNYIYENIYNKNSELYDVILFHEGNINNEHQIYIKSKTPLLPIIFINVSIEFSKDLDKTIGKYAKTLPNNNSFPYGYKCMCRFWTYGFIKYTLNYKYVIRIDEDCFIYNFENNIFNNMEMNNIYFYTAKVIDNFDESQNYAYGLKELTEDFKINNNNNNNINYTSVPYTNFCIIDVNYFSKSDLFNKFCNCIEDEGGIFISRWGDANIWGIYIYLDNIILNNFLVEDKVKYYHGSHGTIIN